MNPEPQVRRGLLARTLFETLRDAGEPLAPKDALARVTNRVPPNNQELSHNASGFPRYETYLRWVSTWSSAIGWMAKRGGWSITEAGVEAIAEFAGDEFVSELTRRYRLHRKQTQQKQSGYGSPSWAEVVKALGYVEAGWWTTYGDLAALTGLSAQSVGKFLGAEKVNSAHRVLRSNGTISPDFHWPDPDRSDDPRQILESEGLRFDESGRAEPDQRITADDLRDQLVELGADGETESPTRRAWLVRGSSVDGHDLVPVWLQKGSASLAAASLRQIDPPVPLTTLKAAIEQDYQHKSYAVREGKIAEFDAFCNRMRVDDYLLTTSQGKTYLGRVAGEATYTLSSDRRSNLRRMVEWLNTTRPVPFANLPQPLPAKLHSQADVVELTNEIAAIEQLLATLGVADRQPDLAAARELRFPEIDQDLAEELLIDQEWLQQQADLLWERKQLIFSGPPGTGKTYLARKLAGHIAEPSAVKLVQFHPSYTYEDFFEGFRPTQRDDGQLTFTLQPGPFRRLVEAARLHPSDPYVLIVDEINRANLAKVFGELYFLLEYRDDAIGLLYSPESDFVMPPNVFFIGTMNTTDRSLGLIDAAMRRRFGFVELHPSGPPTAGLLASWLQRLVKNENVEHNLDAPAVLEALNGRIDDHELALGPSYLMRPQIYRSKDGLARAWETSILPLLADHHYGAPPAVLDKYRLASLRAALAAQQLSAGEPQA
ncbi:MAG: AAA family ATPase [Pseudonocardiales bacterium]|nr:AAA family ATPase [Pseudonocardiales bacterium]